MAESLTIHIPWSAVVEATAAERFEQSADSPSWAAGVAWRKLCFGLALLVCSAAGIRATGIHVARPLPGLPVELYLYLIMTLLVGSWTVVYQALLLYAHRVIARAREARGQAALEAGKVEWRLSSLGLECRAGSRQLLSLAWESGLRVTQFPDGFVLTVCYEAAYDAAKGHGEEVPGAPVFPGPPTRESVRIRQILSGADRYLPNDQYWLPVDAFPDWGVVWFAQMARQLAAEYRGVRLEGSATGSGADRPSEAALALASAVESMVAAGKDTDEIAALVDVFLRQQGGPQEMRCEPNQSLHQTDRP
jgi:hypothetical protein